MLMRLFFVKMAALASAVILSGVLISQYDTRATDDNYLASVLEKDRIIRNTPSPKIILVGGSNLAFGIDSRMLQDSIGMPVVNMGLYAKLGLRYMLAQAKPYIARNDVVVIVPEYEQFYGEFANGDFTLNTALLYAPADRIADFAQSYSLVDVVLRPRVENARRAFMQGLANAVGREDEYFPPQNSAFYSRRAFNDRGDMVAHLGQLAPNPDSIFVGEIPPMRQFSEEVITDLNDVARTARSRRAQAYFMFPSYIDRAYAINGASIDSLRRRLAREMIIPIVGTPQDFVFPSRLFFDTRYHLNEDGRRLRTLRTIEFLRAVKPRE
ncbi:MAG: hypothetical protein ABIR58_08100 [Gemmatimonadaceae bacterium]